MICKFKWADGYEDTSEVDPMADYWRRDWTSRRDCRIENTVLPDFRLLQNCDVSISITVFRREFIKTPTGRTTARFIN